MKKLVLLTLLAISFNSFAAPSQLPAKPGMAKPGINNQVNIVEAARRGPQEYFHLMSPPGKEIFQRNLRAISEKESEINRLLAQQTPNWKRIETLTAEISKLESTNKFELYRILYVNRNSLTNAGSVTQLPGK